MDITLHLMSIDEKTLLIRRMERLQDLHYFVPIVTIGRKRTQGVLVSFLLC